MTYELRESDVGTRLSVILSGWRDGYVTTTRTSPQTNPVEDVPVTIRSFAGQGTATCSAVGGASGLRVLDYGAYWSDNGIAINSGYVPNLSLADSQGPNYSGVYYVGAPSRFDALWYYYANVKLSGTSVQANSGRKYYSYSSSGQYLFGSYRYRHEFNAAWSARVWITCQGQF
jgi:hypothetical protein